MLLMSNFAVEKLRYRWRASLPCLVLGSQGGRVYWRTWWTRVGLVVACPFGSCAILEASPRIHSCCSKAKRTWRSWWQSSQVNWWVKKIVSKGEISPCGFSEKEGFWCFQLYRSFLLSEIPISISRPRIHSNHSYLIIVIVLLSWPKSEPCPLLLYKPFVSE